MSNFYPMFVWYLKPSAPHMFPSTTSPAGPGNQSIRVLRGSDNAMALTPAALRSPLATTVGMSCLSEPMFGIMFGTVMDSVSYQDYQELTC